MKIPYKNDFINLILILLFMLIGITTYELIVTPNPGVYPIIPTLLWEFGQAMQLVTMTWPTSLTIWVICILYLINYFITPAAKSKTKSETIARLLEVNKALSNELIYANKRIDEKVKKLVYAEALVKSNRCPICLEQLETTI